MERLGSGLSSSRDMLNPGNMLSLKDKGAHGTALSISRPRVS